eukprot:403370872
MPASQIQLQKQNEDRLTQGLLQGQPVQKSDQEIYQDTKLKQAVSQQITDKVRSQKSVERKKQNINNKNLTIEVNQQPSIRLQISSCLQNMSVQHKGMGTSKNLNSIQKKDQFFSPQNKSTSGKVTYNVESRLKKELFQLSQQKCQSSQLQKQVDQANIRKYNQEFSIEKKQQKLNASRELQNSRQTQIRQEIGINQSNKHLFQRYTQTPLLCVSQNVLGSPFLKQNRSGSRQSSVKKTNNISFQEIINKNAQIQKVARKKHSRDQSSADSRDSFAYADFLQGTDEFDRRSKSKSKDQINFSHNNISAVSSNLYTKYKQKNKVCYKHNFRSPQSNKSSFNIIRDENNNSAHSDDVMTSLHTLKGGVAPHLMSQVLSNPDGNTSHYEVQDLRASSKILQKMLSDRQSNSTLESVDHNQSLERRLRINDESLEQKSYKQSHILIENTQTIKRCRSPNRSDTISNMLIDRLYNDSSAMLHQEATILNRLNRQKQHNQKVLKNNEQEISNLTQVQKNLQTKVDIQEVKNFQLEEQISSMMPLIEQYRQKVAETRRKFELELYELTLKRQRIRTYVQSLSRDTLQQKEDYELLLEEEKDKIKIAMSVCEEALMIKKRLEQSIKKKEVSEKERDRDLSNKKAKLKKQMKTALICASIDLSRVNEKQSQLPQDSGRQSVYSAEKSQSLISGSGHTPLKSRLSMSSQKNRNNYSPSGSSTTNGYSGMNNSKMLQQTPSNNLTHLDVSSRQTASNSYSSTPLGMQSTKGAKLIKL